MSNSGTAPNALFKSSCNSCIRNKIRCDGNTPCDQCLKKGTTFDCKYAFKKKRGPQSKNAKTLVENGGQKKRARGAEHGVMSAYERRLWTVFFTIFKNQWHTLKLAISGDVSNSNRETYPWCWFARQLDTLYDYCSVACDDRVMQLLGSFLESLDIQRTDLKSNMTKQCPFPPSMCGGCSSAAIKPQSLHCSLESQKLNMDVIEFDSAFSANVEACFRYKQFYSGCMTQPKKNDEHYGRVEVNERFARIFGYDKTRMNDLISWTGGQGFLPWGGDIFAALFVNESDLLLFLQIMSIKYQASDLPDKNAPETGERLAWEIPSTHSFLCWAMNEQGKHVKCRVSFQCTHNSYIDEKGALHTRVEMVTKDITGALAAAVETKPNEGMMNTKIPVYKREPEIAVDSLPPAAQKEFDNWSKYDVVSLEACEAEPLDSFDQKKKLQFVAPPPTGKQPTMQRTSSSTDSLFFGSLLEWAAQNSNSPTPFS